MDKVLVEVFIPAANTSYDVYIPLENRLGEVMPLLNKLITDLSDGKYIATEESVICDRKKGIIYNINLSVAELGMQNGTQLMLI